MASIGPQLPPHLSKRKRTPDDEASRDSPPAKVHAPERARVNQDEVDLGSESEDDYGPAAPKPPTSNTPIGPTLPPPPTTNTDEIALDSEDEGEDDIGPSAPPANPSSIGPAPPPAAAAAAAAQHPKRVHGPAPPPAPLDERPPAPPDSESGSDDDDDDYGPALPTSNSHIARQTQAQAAAAREAAYPSAPKRDDWMLAPPTSGGGYRAPDPTKLKSRKFNSGPRSGSGGGGGGGESEISSIWTETPEQKRKRLEAAVLGRDTPSQAQQKTTTSGNRANTISNVSSSSAAPNGRPKTQEEAEAAARIANFTEATRGRSLYESHQKDKKQKIEEEDDDPSKRAFDREKDMKLGGRIGTAQRRELLNKAADFGGRFAKGKFL